MIAAAAPAAPAPIMAAQPSKGKTTRSTLALGPRPSLAPYPLKTLLNHSLKEGEDHLQPEHIPTRTEVQENIVEYRLSLQATEASQGQKCMRIKIIKNK